MLFLHPVGLCIYTHFCLYIHINSNMPQAGINPPRQSNATYEASAVPPIHHGWISVLPSELSNCTNVFLIYSFHYFLSPSFIYILSFFLSFLQLSFFHFYFLTFLIFKTTFLFISRCRSFFKLSSHLASAIFESFSRIEEI